LKEETKVENKKVEERKMSFGMELLESFVAAMSISIFIYFTLAIPNQVDGASMEPTYHNAELLITNKVSSWLGSTDVGKSMGLDYKRGDVIIFHAEGIELIKRVIAVGGDSIRLHNGSVFVNGKELNEEYLPKGLQTFAYSGLISFLADNETKYVPLGSYFVMGDNRSNSKDSRFTDIGFIKRSDIRGKVWLKYWPLSEFEFIQQGVYTEK